MIVLICGLSGSGKSSMIAALKSEDPSVIHIRASKLLNDAGKPIEDISKEEASSNQDALAALLAKELATNGPLVLIDGHLLIETTTGPYLLSDDALSNLKIDGVVFIAADPELVSYRRRGSDMEASKDAVSQLMQLEAMQAQRFAEARGIQYACVESGDIEAFKSELSNVLRH
jgi:adenylate kinase